MSAAVALAAVAAAVAAAVLMLRAGRLEERHALAWIAGVALVAAVAAGAGRGPLAGALDGGGAAAVLAVALAVVTALLAGAYAALTRVTRQARTLAQRVALLEERLGPAHFGDPSAPDDEGAAVARPERVGRT